MKSLVTIIIIAIISNAQGQNNKMFSLLEAKEYALKNHYKISNADLEYKKAIHQKKQYLAAGMPEANINGNFNQFLNLPVQVLPASFLNPNASEDDFIAFRAGTEFSAGANLQVNQLLFNGSYFIGIEASKLLIELQQIQKARSREDVLFSVIEAYQIAAVAKVNLSFADSIYQLTATLESKQQKFLELGLLSPEELDQMRFAVLRSKNAFENSELQLRNALALLKYTMSYPQDSSLNISNSLTDLELQSTQIVIGSIENNSLIPLLQTQIQLSACDVKNNKAGFLPSVSAFFQQSYNAYRNSFDFFENKPWYSQTNWGLQMRIPVFSSGKGKAIVKQSEIKLMQDENNFQLTKQGLQLQEKQLKNTLESALQKRALQKENTNLAEKIYKNALKKEQLGNGNNVVVTQKLNQVMIAQAEYTASLIEVFKTKLELDKLYNKLN
ncbi:MAG: TolC family protein [Crocinitomicaceae bacterium]